MHRWAIFLFLMAGILFVPVQVFGNEGAECLICEDMKGFAETLHPSGNTPAWRDTLPAFITDLMKKPKYTKAVLLKFDIHDVCRAPNITNLLMLPGAYIQHYEILMTGTQACAQSCNISINTAEYCALNTALSFQISAWPRLSDAFADTAILLDMAGQSDQPVIAQFNVLLDGAAREALRYLEQAMKNLEENTPPVSNDPGFTLAKKELFEAGNILQVLHWTGMAGMTAKAHGKELISLSQALSVLNADLDLALNRAKVLEPKDRRTLAKRIIVLAADIAVIRQSVVRSVQTLRQRKPNTNANATNPLAENALNLGAAGTCLNSLAIETSLVPEFGKMVKDELNACRSFDGCSNRPLSASAMDLQELVERIEANIAKDEKIALAVSQKICN